MSNHLFNKEPVDFTRSALFLDKAGRNISRLDLSVELHISTATAAALGKIWFSGDFSPAKDGKDYLGCSLPLRELFMKNIKFQTLLDSLAARSVAEVFLPITTNPQLESWWYQHSFFECNIHSLSYADILKGLPVDAKAIFDDIMVNPNILARADSIVNCFEDTVVHNAKMVLKSDDYSRELHKVSIVKSLFALNILEAVLFKSSFLTSFAFKENGLFSVTADMISKIAQDEAGHYGMTVTLINRLRNDPEWTYIFKDYSDDIDRLYSDAIQADYMWIDYCYTTDVQLLGVNNVVMKQYVTHNIYSVMSAVGQTPIVDKVPNPCIWANKYSRPSNFQTAQKEKTSGNYMLGIVNMDVSDKDWSNMYD
ncbi:MAG: hypothetical protein DRP15_03915 [Candidatus Aenigmatarchaeota archaeon]|nr:MAG: hypothetical protein DRP15_03915 [Candidatus Aenigmarchaeota archaeon]